MERARGVLEYIVIIALHHHCQTRSANNSFKKFDCEEELRMDGSWRRVCESVESLCLDTGSEGCWLAAENDCMGGKH